MSSDQVAVDETGTDPIEAAASHWDEHGWHGGERMKAALAITRVAALTRQSMTAVLKDSDLTFSRHELLAVLYFSAHGEMSLGRIGGKDLAQSTSVAETLRGRFTGPRS